MLSQDALVEDTGGSESEFYGNEDMDISTSTNLDQSIFAPIISNANEVKAKLQSAFKDLETLSPVHAEEQKFLNNTRVLVSITKIQELKGNICSETLGQGEFCGQSRTFEYDTRGTVLVLRWSCSNNHAGLWKSSEVLCRSYTTDIYLNDTLVSACIFLSGNNYSKFSLFCKFLNLKIPDVTTFTRVQRYFSVPAILALWKEMKEKVCAVLNPYKELCLIGDGRNDSPGFSARFCVYVLMEQFTSVLMDLEVLDKRETRGISPNMEREGLKRLLLRLMDKISISEIATDASSSIIKCVDTLKGMMLKLNICNRILEIL